MPSEYELEKVATRFVLYAIIGYGDDPIEATQSLLDAARFDATATCGPVFGGIWPKPCEGPDGEEATKWLKELTDTMKRGKFEWERDHVLKFLQERLKEKE